MRAILARYLSDRRLFCLYVGDGTLNRPFGTVRDLSIPFDQVIPLWPWTVVIT